MRTIKVYLRSQYAALLKPDTTYMPFYQFFRSELTTYRFMKQGWGKKAKVVKTKDKSYYYETEDSFFIPRGVYDLFVEYAQKYGMVLDVEKLPVDKWTKKKALKTSKDIVPYDYQEAAMDKLLMPPRSIVLLGLATGLGKTLTSLIMSSRLGGRTLICLRAGYIPGWKKAIQSLMNPKKGEMVHIEGGDALRTVMATPYKIRKAKIIIVSNTLYRNYINEYAKEPNEFSYDILPVDLLPTLRVDNVIIDELHQDTEFWFKFISVATVGHIITLTATFLPSDRQVKTIYDSLIPDYDRYIKLEAKKYITLINMYYGLKSKVDVINQSLGGYDHKMLEKKIMKLSKYEYLSMIKHAMDKIYTDRAKPGEKCIIYMSLVDNLEILKEYLLKYDKDKKILIYIAGVPASEIEDSDIVLTTYVKAGTALDIDGLVSVVNTLSLSSDPANIQLFGRLRVPKPGQSEKVAVQIQATNLPQHVNHTVNRRRSLENKVVKTINVLTEYKFC